MTDRYGFASRRLELALQESFLGAAAWARRGIDAEDLETAVDTQDEEAMLAALGVTSEGLPALEHELFDRLSRAAQTAYNDIGNAVLADLALPSGRHSISSAVAVRDRIVQGIVSESAQALRDAVARARPLGRASGLAATLLKNSVGLTALQARSLAAFTRALSAAEARGPQLRVGIRIGGERRRIPVDVGSRILTPQLLRFLNASQRSVLQGAFRRGIDNDSARVLIEKQARALLKHRAAALAATEATRFAAQAAEDAVLQAIKDGRLRPGEVRRYWQTAGDEKVRLAHSAVPTMNPRGVGVGEPFKTPFGARVSPPLEVNCRCRVEYRRT